MTLPERLKKFVRGEVAADETTLQNFSRDAGFLAVKPEAVVFPKDVEDLMTLVSYISREKKKHPSLSLTARSAGTDMSGGPINESVIVCFTKYFNRIKEVGDDYAVCEPGVYYRDLEKETLKRGLIFPSYPASRDICAVGGIVANNAGGEKSLRYGKTVEHVLRLKAVLANGAEYTFERLDRAALEAQKKEPGFAGEIYRRVFALVERNFDLIKSKKPAVSKNSAGYNLFDVWDRKNFDLHKLFVGAQGTLGLITEATLRLVPKARYSKLLVIFLNDLQNLPRIVNTILSFKPESFETYDRHTFSLALKFLPEIVAKLGKNVFLFFQFWPEFLMLLRGGVPDYIMMPEFAGNDPDEIDSRLHAVQEALSPLGLMTRVADSPAEVQKYFAIRRESFNLLRQKIKNRQTAPFIDDWIVAPERLPEFLPELNKILSRYPDLIYTVAGHIGDGNFHIIPLMNLHNPQERAVIKPLMDEVFDLTIRFGGSITAEHNDGLIRTPYLEKMFGPEVCRLFAEVKNIFDPQGIFNPGKKVGGSLDYALTHITAK